VIYNTGTVDVSNRKASTFLGILAQLLSSEK